MSITRFIIAGGFAVAAQCAFAETLYKLIDKNGKVTYSQEKPKDYDGQVIPITIDPNANTTTSTVPKANFSKPAPGTEGVPATNPDEKKAKGDPVKLAQDRLDKAKAALQDAQDNPSDSDFRWIGNVGGGTRRQPTEEYQKRLEKLEQNVRDAEDNLKQAERGI